MNRSFEDIRAIGPDMMLDEPGKTVTTREALIVAYSAVERDNMHNMANRNGVLAVLRNLLLKDDETPLIG